MRLKLIGLIVAMTLLGLGGGQAGAAASQRGASSPINAVKAVLPTAVKPTGKPCHPASAGPDREYRISRGCPITQRLEKRIHKLMRKVEADPVCRCQNAPNRISYRAFVGRNSARVNARLMFGTQSSRITFVVVRRDGWRVSDSYCTAKPKATSIYQNGNPCT